MAASRATIAQLETEQRQTLAIGTGRDLAAKRADLYTRQLQRGRLRAEYDTRANAYNDLRLRYERTATLTAQLYIVAPPTRPDQPLPRGRRQFAALGAIVGLVCGMFFALLIDSRNRA
jgi:LPS O-antigen subunit length determinant protein (WzzB/FepE family)